VAKDLGRDFADTHHQPMRLDILDLNNDGIVCVDDILAALRDVAEVSVHEDEQSLAQFVHSYANISGNG